MSEPDLPLFRWQEQVRERRAQARQTANARRETRHALLLASGPFAALALAATSALAPAPRLVWNASASAPIGLYAVSPGARLARGDIVIARLPAPLRGLAAKRRYLPENVPLVKRIAAMPGDAVCALDAAITVNGTIRAVRLQRDGQGRLLPWWRGCRLLGTDEYLLLMPARTSFDGRYFGPVHAAQILGRATPLWVR